MEMQAFSFIKCYYGYNIGFTVKATAPGEVPSDGITKNTSFYCDIIVSIPQGEGIEVLSFIVPQVKTKYSIGMEPVDLRATVQSIVTTLEEFWKSDRPYFCTLGSEAILKSIESHLK
jgi:hypothetical protein